MQSQINLAFLSSSTCAGFHVFLSKSLSRRRFKDRSSVGGSFDIKNPLANLKCVNYTEGSKMRLKSSEQRTSSPKLMQRAGTCFNNRLKIIPRKSPSWSKDELLFTADVYYGVNDSRTVLFFLRGISLCKHRIKIQFCIYPAEHALELPKPVALTLGRCGSNPLFCLGDVLSIFHNKIIILCYLRSALCRKTGPGIHK